MADLEAVLADVSYLMAMEKSKTSPAARASKKIVLPDPSVKPIMHRHLTKMSEITFEKVFNQRIGYELFKEFCDSCDEPVPQMKFYEEIRQYEQLDCDEERIEKAKEIYDNYIMKELLAVSHTYTKKAVLYVQEKLSLAQKTKNLPGDIFEMYKEEIKNTLTGRLFEKFLESEKYTRFCQWKNLELNISLSMNDFSVHRIIGRGGFGEVYGARKADTGKMFAMKCLDKKRIKLKGGETLALNERIMLSLASTEGCPFLVNMTYAFQTPEKLSFVLDLMNGGDLHYHLSQHGVFSEKDVRFYAAETLLGLEHMHKRTIVYRDLKPANILLDEGGHLRISDLGLACDYSRKKPHASVGTHGYMAPEVLQKGVAYDASADWFSFGCMLYKLLKGHSPFRHHKSKDKNEIDKMTMTMSIELPDSMTAEIRSLLEGLLKREVSERLGCRGRGADEIKSHPFFDGFDWQLAMLRKYSPPLIPPRGEVNAADAFEIGNFDEDDVKGIKLSEMDQEIYKNFNTVVSQRWQDEVVETVFENVNSDTDKLENKRRQKQQQIDDDENSGETDCIVEGELLKLGGPFLQKWEKRYLKLFPNRFEFYHRSRDGAIVRDKGVELVSMTDIRDITSDFTKVNKMDNVLILYLKNDHKIALTSLDKVLISQWKEDILISFKNSNDFIANMNKKVSKLMGGASESSKKRMREKNNSLEGGTGDYDGRRASQQSDNMDSTQQLIAE